jgi:hypothetical protein
LVARSIKYIIDIEDASKAEQGNSTLEIVSTRQVLWLQLLIIEQPRGAASSKRLYARGAAGKANPYVRLYR